MCAAHVVHDSAIRYLQFVPATFVCFAGDCKPHFYLLFTDGQYTYRTQLRYFSKSHIFLYIIDDSYCSNQLLEDSVSLGKFQTPGVLSVIYVVYEYIYLTLTNRCCVGLRAVEFSEILQRC